jgi:exopolyphosphatase/pppGpp-phosphohydrolase
MQQIRTGVIEIGSRGIRLLIADLSNKLQVVNTAYQDTQLARIISKQPASLPDKLKEIISITNGLCEKVQQLQCRRICIFGTEAMRSLPNDCIVGLKKSISQLEILSEKDEARCSLLGAVSPFDGLIPSETQFVIDQGTGSVELAVGKISTSDVELAAYKSYRLGTEELVEELDACNNNYSYFFKKIEAKIRKLKLIEVDARLTPIILGSAATKFAWIKVKQQIEDRYEPGKVHGQILEKRSIDQLLSLADKHTEELRRIIDPHSTNMDEFKIVLAGLVGIKIMLDQLGKKSFKVSAYGPRYGAAWLCGVGKTMGFDV